MTTNAGPLLGRVALITGGSRGIGRATALILAARGAAVAPLARTKEDVEATRTAIHEAGGRTTGLSLIVDVRDAAGLATAAHRAARELGPIDILVVAAGVARFRTILETTPAEWDEQLAVNLTGAWNAVRAVLPGMIEQGRGDIVLIASVAARKAFANCGAYGASKAGLVMMGDVLREETRRHGVRVTSILAGATETEIWGSTLPAPPERLMSPDLVGEAIADVVALPLRGSIEEIVLRPPLGDL
ncbi:MAG: SDR family oxidoreductase [Candidatus Eisenbacteria bacterium]|nr:SDR family oxidoreductase [Candidatus Eisenbacteria bacterium]